MSESWPLVLDQNNVTRERLRSQRLDETQVDALLRLPFDIELTRADPRYGFVVEAAIRRAENLQVTDTVTVGKVMESIMPLLQDVHWKSTETNDHHYYCLRVLRESLLAMKASNQLDQLNMASDVIASLATHCDEECPWGSHWGCEVASNTCASLRDYITKNLSQFIDDKVAPKCSQLSKLEKHTKDTRKKQLSGGLRPQLGYGSGVGATQNEDSIRSKWYSSNDIAAIAMVHFLIGYFRKIMDEPDSPEKKVWDANWYVVTSFILNLTDDTKVEFKLASCRLLNRFLDDIGTKFLQKKGLLDPFIESIGPNLTYLPSLTPTGDSLRLLPPSYKAILHMLQSSEHSHRSILELISTRLLSSISHVKGNSGASSVLVFLLQQLSTIITEYVQEDVLVLLSRINFVVSQLIIDPNERESKVIVASLEIQKSILELFLSTGAKKLVYDYRFDFIGAWGVLLKRSLSSNDYTGILRTNMSLLFEYANSLGVAHTWHLELEKVKAHTSDQLQAIIIQQQQES